MNLPTLQFELEIIILISDLIQGPTLCHAAGTLGSDLVNKTLGLYVTGHTARLGAATPVARVKARALLSVPLCLRLSGTRSGQWLPAQI